MSYLDQTNDFRRRATAIAGVAAIHAAIGIGLVVGLTVTGVAPPIDIWNAVPLTPDPQRDPPPPEPSPRQPAQTSVVVIPPTPLPPLGQPENTLVPEAAVETSTVLTTTAGPLVGPTTEPFQSTLFTPRRARPANDPLRWITTNDYPGRDLRNENEGVAGYRLIVGTNGRVSACELTRSTGHVGLDQATCEFIARRARFEPATDETGAKVVGGYTGTVKWDIPE